MSDTDKLAEALAKAQGSMHNPERNRTVQVQTLKGGTYTFAYATLDSIMDLVRKPLSDNGLAITHNVVSNEGAWLCSTRLLHSSGQFIECLIPIVVAEAANAQGWGSALTYAKRYGVCALLALAAEEDDDGNSACGNAATQDASKKPPAKPTAKSTWGNGTPPPPKDKPWIEKTEPEKLEWAMGELKNIGDMQDTKAAMDRLKKFYASKSLNEFSAENRVKINDTAFRVDQDLRALLGS